MYLSLLAIRQRRGHIFTKSLHQQNVDSVLLLRYNKKVVIPTRSSWRGLSIDVRGGGVNVGSPTLLREKPFILRKGVSLLAKLFFEMSFFYPTTG